jgi:hypothetical protein
MDDAPEYRSAIILRPVNRVAITKGLSPVGAYGFRRMLPVRSGFLI